MKPLKYHPTAVKPQLRVFICPECGTRNTYTKVFGRTKQGHVKTCWCYICKQETDQIQLD